MLASGAGMYTGEGYLPRGVGEAYIGWVYPSYIPWGVYTRGSSLLASLRGINRA